MTLKYQSDVMQIIEQRNKYVFWLISAAIAAGFILTIISWQKICSEACSESHHYRLFGHSFETFGFLFFVTLALSHFLSLKYSILTTITGWLLISGLGAEMVFIYLQKYKIGKWCPVCLGIATAIGVGAIAFFWEYLARLKSYWTRQDKDQIMKSLSKGLAGSLVFIATILVTIMGVDNQSRLQAQENSIKESIAFGNPKSPIEVYVFTDWACPACRALEPSLGNMSAAIMKKGKLTFVDFAIHPETLNYTPYNLSFMVYNKEKYFKLRKALSDLSEKTGTPSDQQIEKVANANGTRYHQLNYADIALGIKYYKHLADQFKIEGTPTIAIINRETKKGKKLAGISEISEEKVLKAIESLKTK